MTLKRVVVTGIGALTPIGNNAKEYWDNLLMGKSGAAPITRFDASISRPNLHVRSKILTSIIFSTARKEGSLTFSASTL